MKYIIVFETEIEIETDDIENGIRLAKAEADGMSRILWANTNYPRFKVKDVRVDYELDKKIMELRKNSDELIEIIKNSR